jgi:hypothetical protein
MQTEVQQLAGVQGEGTCLVRTQLLFGLVAVDFIFLFPDMQF